MAARLAPANWGLSAAFAAVSVLVGLLAGVDPKLAIAASVAIGFVLIVFANLTAGLAIFAFFSSLELLNLGSAISVSKLGGALLALGWVAFVVTHNDAKSDFLSVHPGMSLVLGLFLGWIAISALWAESSSEVVGNFGRYALNVILFLIVFSAVRTRPQATLVVGAFVAGAAAAGFYGLAVATTTQQVYGERITGGTLDPNELASVVVAGVALAGALFIGLKGRPWLQASVLVAGGFCFLTVFLTGSRGGLVAMSAMLLAAIFLSGRWRPRVLIASAVLAVIGVYYIAALAPPEIRERIESSASGETRFQDEGRSTLWQVGTRMAKENPLNGVGAGNFQTSSRHYVLRPGAVQASDIVLTTPQVAHNTYLEIAAELGIVGLTLFGSLLAFALICSLRAAANFKASDDIAGEALARGVAIALVGVLVADFFISQQLNKQLWLLLGIAPAILAVSRKSDAAGLR